MMTLFLLCCFVGVCLFIPFFFLAFVCLFPASLEFRSFRRADALWGDTYKLLGVCMSSKKTAGSAGPDIPV